MRQFLADEAATVSFAESLLDSLPLQLAGWTILLSGELGAGKSTFARALISAAGHDGAVPSPTYTLVEPYDVDRGRLYHVDLYRVSGSEELHYLGFSELDDGCRLIEWPDRAPGLRDDADLILELSYDADGRTVELLGLSGRGVMLVDALTGTESSV